MNSRAQSFGALGALAWVRLQTGEAAGARRAPRWDDLISEVRTPPGQAYLYSRFTHTDRARVALALGDVDLAEQVLDAVRELSRESGIRDVGACAPRAGGVRRGTGIWRAPLLCWRPAWRSRVRRVRGAAAGAGAVTGDALHVEAARALIDEIAASVRDASRLGAGFRAAALEELAAAGAPAPS
jgi:hypothetical protein